MAHLFLEFRDNANVESQVGVMLTFIHSCGCKFHNVRKIISVYQLMDGWMGGWMDGRVGGWAVGGCVGGGREGLREKGWGRENEWTNKEMKSKKSRNK